MRSGLLLDRTVLAGVVAGVVAGVSCGTVDLGPTPADVNACRPSQKFFAEKIWPEYLGKDFGGKHCYDGGGCHGPGSGRLMVLAFPGGTPTVPLSPEWNDVYNAASDQLFCTSVAASPLIEKPSDLGHGGTKLIEPDGAEAALVKMWVTAP
jgi:hypothetical protein